MSTRYWYLFAHVHQITDPCSTSSTLISLSRHSFRPTFALSNFPGDRNVSMTTRTSREQRTTTHRTNPTTPSPPTLAVRPYQHNFAFLVWAGRGWRARIRQHDQRHDGHGQGHGRRTFRCSAHSHIAFHRQKNQTHLHIKRERLSPRFNREPTRVRDSSFAFRFRWWLCANISSAERVWE